MLGDVLQCDKEFFSKSPAKLGRIKQLSCDNETEIKQENHIISHADLHTFLHIEEKCVVNL